MSTCEKKKVRYNAVATYVLDSDGKLSEEQINQIRWRMLDALDHVNDFIPVLQSFECDSAEIIESPDQPKEILPLINAGNLTGDLSGIWGSATGLSGVATGLRGDVSGISGVRRGINGISGDVSGISGDVTYITGDVSGGLHSTSVDKIKAQPVASTTPASGQVLTWDGTQWAPATNSTGGGGGQPRDNFALNYTGISQVYSQQNKDSTKKGNAGFGWDLVKNIAATPK